MATDISQDTSHLDKQDVIASLAMMAAMADRTLTLEERASLRKIMDGLSETSKSAIYQKVFLGTGSIEDEVDQLDSEALRMRGYSIVSAICESDGVISKKEQQFLTRLRTSMAFSAVIKASEMRETATR